MTAVGCLLAGCTGTSALGESAPVGVLPPHPSAAVTRICQHFGEVLPGTLEDLASRSTQPYSPLTYAWGDPAVILRCGVPVPAGYSPSSSPTVAVDGVRWFQHVGTSVVEWTAIRPGARPSRRIYVTVAIPTQYDAQDSYLVDLAPALRLGLR